MFIGLVIHAGSSWRVFQPGEDRELKEGAPALIRDHYRWGEGLSQPPARLHHQRAASWLSSQRWHHQKRYGEASGPVIPTSGLGAPAPKTDHFCDYSVGTGAFYKTQTEECD